MGTAARDFDPERESDRRLGERFHPTRSWTLIGLPIGGAMIFYLIRVVNRRDSDPRLGSGRKRLTGCQRNAIHSGRVMVGIPIEFILFALTLLGVGLFHRHTLAVAVWRGKHRGL